MFKPYYLIMYERGNELHDAPTVRAREQYKTFDEAKLAIEQAAVRWPRASWRILRVVAIATPAANLTWEPTKEVY